MNIKKIIVKDGLILIGIFVVAYSLNLLGNSLANPGKGVGLDEATFHKQFEIIGFYLYPLYLFLHPLVRFIIWAKDIKNMPARVGLVLLGCVLVGCLAAGIVMIGSHFYGLYLKQKEFFHHAIITFLDPYYSLKQVSIVIAIGGYPLYGLASLIARAFQKSHNRE